jgi:hypothetical protein
MSDGGGSIGAAREPGEGPGSFTFAPPRGDREEKAVVPRAVGELLRVFIGTRTTRDAPHIESDSRVLGRRVACFGWPTSFMFTPVLG